MGSTTEVSPQFDRDKGAENGQTVIVIHIEIVIVENLFIRSKTTIFRV